ncbi:hypothetical protein RSSM_03446 [Rhodopirellula sallentina SM41]|uniref:Uncharacterized protein n=1 Tax=Rhodopirellula sallentina SM41 TaxID=1263870 RepID=M5U0Z5_9BACT|nr:hypothetical protein RSSM_03446 [Rhodopirellula sallentina SM41]
MAICTNGFVVGRLGGVYKGSRLKFDSPSAGDKNFLPGVTNHPLVG